MRPVVLASRSPRRSVLLSYLLDGFEVDAQDVDESVPSGLGVDEVVAVLARKKALAGSRSRPDAWVLGADTLVAVGDQVVGKVHDEADVRRLLGRLLGRTHHVWTGLAIAWDSQCVASRSVVSAVHMDVLPDEVLERYISSGRWRGKAGGYGIQDGLLAPYVRVQVGPWSNVVGLPLHAVHEMFGALGIVHREPPAECVLMAASPF